MRVRVKYVFIRFIFASIWFLFIEGGERSEHYVYFGEFDGVKIWHNSNININELNYEQKKAVKHIEITKYQRWEPYYKQKVKKPKTKPLFVIEPNFY